MAKQTKTTITRLMPDENNANIHSEHGTALLKKSVAENGFGRSILISNDNVIIAGNGLTETAIASGAKNVRIIETDGKEIIAVKRTDINSNTPEFFNMALADNITAKENIVMNAEVMQAIVTDFPGVTEWVEPMLEKSGSKNNLPHDERFLINLHFSKENYDLVKDLINNSGETAEQFFLKKLNIVK